MTKPDETPDEMQARLAKEIAAAGAATEAQMRDMEDAHPRTPKELVQVIKALVERPHDYGTCVFAMSLAAVAAFNYVAHKLGVTGFQASCADMDILRRTRGLEHPFMIVDAGKLLYPQSADVLYDVKEFLRKSCDGLVPAARKLLLETPPTMVHPDVRAHWQAIVDGVRPV